MSDPSRDCFDLSLPGGRTLRCTKDALLRDLSEGRIKETWLVRDLETGMQMPVRSLLSASAIGGSTLGNRSAATSPGSAAGLAALTPLAPATRGSPACGSGGASPSPQSYSPVMLLDQLPQGFALRRLAPFETWTVHKLGDRMQEVAGTCVNECLNANPKDQPLWSRIHNDRERVEVELEQRRPAGIPITVFLRAEWVKMGNGFGVDLAVTWRRTPAFAFLRAIYLWPVWTLALVAGGKPEQLLAPRRCIGAWGFLMILCGYGLTLSFDHQIKVALAIALVFSGFAAFLAFWDHRLIPQCESRLINLKHQASDQLGAVLTNVFGLTGADFKIEPHPSPNP